MNPLRAYFALGTLATVGSVIGIGAGISSLFGHHGGGGSNTGQAGGPPVYVPTGLGSADQTFQQLMQLMTGGSTGAQGAINPAIMQAFEQLMGIPTGGLTQAGQQAGAYSGGAAANADQIQQAFTRNAANMTNAGNQLWQTALDPQSTLKNQLKQEVTDASRAGTSARGIGMSGNAAGLESDAVGNFLTQWQNQQLGRQAQGLQGMGQADAQAGRDYSGGFDITTMIPQLLMQSGQLPYQSQVTAAGMPFNFANMFTGAQGGANNLSGDIMNQLIRYMNYGSGAGQSAFGQNQTNLNNLTSGLGSFGSNFFGGPQGNSPWNQLQSMFGYYGGSGGSGSNPGGYTNSGYPEP